MASEETGSYKGLVWWCRDQLGKYIIIHFINSANGKIGMELSNTSAYNSFFPIMYASFQDSLVFQDPTELSYISTI